MRWFPIQNGGAIPWSMIEPHDRQCRRNHGDQDLERIAQRGGLGPVEAIAVLDSVSLFSLLHRSDYSDEKYRVELASRRLEYESMTGHAKIAELAASIEKIRVVATEEHENPDVKRQLVPVHGQVWYAIADAVSKARSMSDDS